METAEHKPGRPLQCMSIAVEVEKERIIDEHGQTVERTGLRIGGGIDVERTPYCDRVRLLGTLVYLQVIIQGVYITFIEPNSPAERAGLRCHDKILQVCL